VPSILYQLKDENTPYNRHRCFVFGLMRRNKTRCSKFFAIEPGIKQPGISNIALSGNINRLSVQTILHQNDHILGRLDAAGNLTAMVD
jgi:hypothetical protein